MKEHVVHQKHTDLKQKMRELNQGFERLRKITHEGYSDDSGERRLLLAQCLLNESIRDALPQCLSAHSLHIDNYKVKRTCS